jgi:hypothetical protein
MRSLVPILSVLALLSACASAPRPLPPEVTPADPDAALPASVRALPSPPWVFAMSEAVVAPLPPGLVADRTPARSEDELAYIALVKPVLVDRLPTRLRALVGQTLTFLDDAGVPACQARLKGFSARVFLDAEGPGTWELLNPEVVDDNGNVVTDPPPLPEAERFEAAFQANPQRLVADFENPDGTPFAACSRAVLAGKGEAAQVDDVQPFLAVVHTQSPVLTRASAAPELAAAAVEQLRAHGFWEMQQQAYVHSIEAERTRARQSYEAEIADAKARRAKKKELAEIVLDDRTTGLPKTWDEVSADDSNPPDVSTFTDATGRQRAVVLAVGNDVSCAAPRGWMAFLVDAKRQLTPLTFGLGPAPTAVLDLDGGLDLGFGAFFERRIERIDLQSDQPALLRLGAGDGRARLDCSYEQLPPLGSAQ